MPGADSPAAEEECTTAPSTTIKLQAIKRLCFCPGHLLFHHFYQRPCQQAVERRQIIAARHQRNHHLAGEGSAADHLRDKGYFAFAPQLLLLTAKIEATFGAKSEVAGAACARPARALCESWNGGLPQRGVVGLVFMDHAVKDSLALFFAGAGGRRRVKPGLPLITSRAGERLRVDFTAGSASHTRERRSGIDVRRRCQYIKDRGGILRHLAAIPRPADPPDDEYSRLAQALAGQRKPSGMSQCLTA